MLDMRTITLWSVAVEDVKLFVLAFVGQARKGQTHARHCETRQPMERDSNVWLRHHGRHKTAKR